MVEIDSSQSTGSCTKVVRAAETRLKAAGFGADDMQVVIPEGKPDDGNIVARIRAKNPAKKGVLLLAHIDVVDAAARTGSAIRSSSSRKTVSSTAAAPPTTSRWQRCSST